MSLAVRRLGSLQMIERLMGLMKIGGSKAVLSLAERSSYENSMNLLMGLLDGRFLLGHRKSKIRYAHLRPGLPRL